MPVRSTVGASVSMSVGVAVGVAILVELHLQVLRRLLILFTSTAVTAQNDHQDQQSHEGDQSTYNYVRLVTLEFFLNGAELILNSVNSGNLIDH